MKFWIGLCCCMVWLVSQETVAQSENPYADSLIRLLPTVHDTVKVKVYHELSGEFSNRDFAKSIHYAEEGLALAKKLQNHEVIGHSLDVIGSVYSQQGGYAKGLEYKLKALEVYKESGNKKGIMIVNNNVGVLHFRNQNYQQAIYHYRRALETAEELHSQENISTYLLNIGEVYQKQKLWDKAIEYELASLKISEKLGIGDNRAYAYGILGQVYKEQGKFEKAIDYQKKTIEIFNRLQDPMAEAEYLIRIAETYQAKRDIPNALVYAQKGLDLATKIKSIEWLKEAYAALADIHVARGDTITAYKFHKKYAALKDTMLNESMVKQLAQLQTLYQTSEQQARIDLLTKDKIIQDEAIQIRNLLLFFFIGGFILIGLFVRLLYKNNVQKKRDNALLQIQKNEIEKFNEDITASIVYAKRIQDAMLPALAQVQKHLPAHFILFQPRDVVSGDFYWFQEKNGLLFLSAIDCTGHGVPGAFMSMMGDALLNQIVLDKHLQHPDLILNQMHREIRKTLRQEDNENKDGMDLSLVVINKATQTLEFAGAHCPMVLIQRKELQYIKGDRLSVGGFQPEKERIFTRKIFSIAEPTHFYLFSDGYQDQFGGAERRKFSIARFRELLLEIHLMDFEAQKEYLAQTYHAWINQSHEKQIDDVLVIGVGLF